VIIARSDGDDVGGLGWSDCFAIVIITPPQHRSVFPHRLEHVVEGGKA